MRNVWTYDPVGNRLTKNTTSDTYDRADRILTAGSLTDTVNANGNLTNRGADTLVYDQANRLTSATVSGTTSTDTYDGDGKRASQTVGTTTTSYVYDVNTSLPDVLADGTFKYVYGLSLAYAVDGSGTVQVYHTDGLGSVRAITNSSGTLIQTDQTDEFGIPTNSQGASPQPFGFTGQQADSNGLIYLRSRYYDPTTGRFLSQDPLFGSMASPLSLNLFSYVLNNPVALIDASGFSVNRVTRNGSTDNECFSTAGGLFQGYIVNARCLDAPAGSQVIVAIVQTPTGPRMFSTVVFAKPRGGSGQDNGLLDRLNREHPGRYTNDESAARKALRLSKIQFRAAMHFAKNPAFKSTNPDVIIDTVTGDVLAPRSGDVIGNLLDELSWRGLLKDG